MPYYPRAITKFHSPVRHDDRRATWGVVIHWTVGHEAGDIATLTSGIVDVQFYVTKKGAVYQFMDSDSEAWHGRAMANNYTVGIETEGAGESWTTAQTEAMVELCAWLSKTYNIPVVKVDPSGVDPVTFKGFFGHKDLSMGGVRVDGNDHTDTVPDNPGWAAFLGMIRDRLEPKVTRYYFEIPSVPGAVWGPYKFKGIRNARMYMTKIKTGRSVRPFSMLERVT